MRTHQKYLPVRGPDGLLPHFIAVMDNAEDRKGFIAKGNEWVLNARLADARFFFEEDVRKRLESRLPQLARLDLPGPARRLPSEDRPARGARRGRSPASVGRRGPGRLGRGLAARLSKADLTTRMVKEFTDLQGVVGGIYARREGLARLRLEGRSTTSTGRRRTRRSAPRGGGRDPRRSPTVSTRSPASSGSAWCPPARRTRTACAAPPLGSSRSRSPGSGGVDWKPIARAGRSRSIRRRSRGPGRTRRWRSWSASSPSGCAISSSAAGTSYDEISAVARRGDLGLRRRRRPRRAPSPRRAARWTSGRSILAFKRIRNILGGRARPAEPSAELYREEAERALAADFLQARQAIERAPLRRGATREAMETIASIAPSLDRFFVEVLVNAPEEDLRRNRLAPAGRDSARILAAWRIFRRSWWKR